MNREYPDHDWRHYEGLVKGTIKHYGLPPDQEYEDVEQTLRMKVLEALQKYDESKGSSRRSFVFGCVANRMRDLWRKKVVSESSWEEVTGSHDQAGSGTAGHIRNLETKLGLEVTEEQVYGHVWEEDFVLPSTLTHTERLMAEGLMEGVRPRDIMAEHGITRQQWMQGLRSLRAKMADWEPPAPDDDDELRLLMEEAPVGR